MSIEHYGSWCLPCGYSSTIDHAEHWQLKPGGVGSIPPSNCWLFPFCLITSYFKAILRLVQEEQDYLTPWNTSTNFMDSTYLPATDESSLLTLFLESFLGWGGFNTIERNSCEQPHFLVHDPTTSFTEVTNYVTGINLMKYIM